MNVKITRKHRNSVLLAMCSSVTFHDVMIHTPPLEFMVSNRPFKSKENPLHSYYISSDININHPPLSSKHVGPFKVYHIGQILGVRVSKSERRLSNNRSGLLAGRWTNWVCYYSTAGTTELKSAKYQSGWMNVFSSAAMLQLEKSWGIKTVSSHVLEDCMAQQKSAVTDTAGAKRDVQETIDVSIDIQPVTRWYGIDLQ